MVIYYETTKNDGKDMELDFSHSSPKDEVLLPGKCVQNIPHVGTELGPGKCAYNSSANLVSTQN